MSHPDRLPDLTQQELAAVLQWAREAKAGRPMLLRRCPETGEVVRVPMGETERPSAPGNRNFDMCNSYAP